MPTPLSRYRSTPAQITGMPRGIPFIIGNELAERFSFYGMKGILTVFMTKHLLDSAGQPDYMNDEEAKTVYHAFTAAAYFFPLLGSLLSDIFLGKYRTIIVLSLGYCIGHACLAMGDTGAGVMPPRAARCGCSSGLAFIAMGAGGIKPCVSAHVGDQFGTKNQHLVSKVFSLVLLLDQRGRGREHAAHARAPGEGRSLARVRRARHPDGDRHLRVLAGTQPLRAHPPAGPKRFVEETFSREGLRALLNLSPIFLIFIPMFWAIFDQTGSAWVLQAMDMDRNFMGVEWLESQIQAANPILILILIPTFAYVIYPAVDRVWKMTPLRKIGVGLFTTAVAFSISAWIEMRIEAGATPNIGWQLLAYVVLTAAEVMVSITSLEFAYTQAPKKMKSFIMGIYFLGVSLGNLFTAAVNFVIQNEDGTSKLEGSSYYWFFTGLMVVTAVIFVFMAMAYRGRTFVQGEDEALTAEADAEAVGNV